MYRWPMTKSRMDLMSTMTVMSHIAQDVKDVAADPFTGHMKLSSISTGAVATTATAEYLASVYKVGEAAYAD